MVPRYTSNGTGVVGYLKQGPGVVVAAPRPTSSPGSIRPSLTGCPLSLVDRQQQQRRRQQQQQQQQQQRRRGRRRRPSSSHNGRAADVTAVTVASSPLRARPYKISSWAPNCQGAGQSSMSWRSTGMVANTGTRVNHTGWVDAAMRRSLLRDEAFHSVR